MLANAKRAKEICSVILGIEGNGIRSEGLVDCESEMAFDAEFDTMRQTWPTEFNKWLDTTHGRLGSVSDMINVCMLKVEDV